MKQIYLDNGATTPLCDAAKAKIAEAMETFGNPSSLHPAGQAARKLVEDARREIAAGNVANYDKYLRSVQNIFEGAAEDILIDLLKR